MNYPPPGGGYAPPSPYGQPPSPYGVAPNPYGAPPPPMGMGYGPPNVMPGMMPMQQKNPGLAIALELLGGFFFQTFGIGNLYAGNVGAGIGLMLGYWVLTAINFALCFVFIGLITWPLTWILFAILSPILANNAAKKANGLR
jgi:TM2 domain-containing membrane protein YozV